MPPKDNAKYPKAVKCVFDGEIMARKYGFPGAIPYNFLALFVEDYRMNHDKGLYYSGDESLTITSLRSLEDCSSDLYPGLQKRTQEQGVDWILEGEESFHFKLLCIKPKPYILYYMGNLALLQQPILGIVGPRLHSQYATQVLQQLFSFAKHRHLVTISGLAPGVDQLCHRFSLEQGIPTIAILGGGIRHYLQTSDRELMHQIVDHGGLILSEFKLDQSSEYYTFPQRNRIIAGLSDVLFLPEAGKDSGSLITVNCALDMHKPVYGVPNSIFSMRSEGLHEMMSQGKIKLVDNIPSFLDTFFPTDNLSHKEISREDISNEEKNILEMISEKGQCGLADFTDFPSHELLPLLTFLEMKNYIYQESPGIYKIL